MAQYLTLLRGINVGGKSLIKMAELKQALQDDGFANVKTYIQSGNVFVTTPERSKIKVADSVSATIAEQFDLDVRVVAFTKADWTKVVNSAPKWWGGGDGWRHDLFVMIPPFKMKDVMTAIGEAKEDIEHLEAGVGVVYGSLDLAKYGRTTTSRLPGKPVYKQMTIRNYNTATKLLSHFD
jgi:uncharacterized protein (DUF1697 family)